MKTNIIAVDFDGTLCINEFPEIGEPITDTIEYIKKKKKNGDKIILWTSRNEEQTKKAVEWCSEQGLTFDAVNENLPEIIEAFGGDCRKIFANEYIDDRNKLVYECREKSNMEKWAENEVSYSDINRCYGVNIDSPNSSYHSWLIDNIVAEMYPITMPYIPYDKPFKVYTEDFLTDPKNGDFDTVGIFYVITPAGKRVEINRYFKDAENGYDEINKAEYLIRKEQAYAKGVKEEDGDTND